jgi:hypothetical protein
MGFLPMFLSQGDPSFLSGRAKSILLFFSWTRISPILKSAWFWVNLLSHSGIYTRIIIILLISTLNIN